LPVSAASEVRDASNGWARRKSARAGVEAERMNGVAHPANRGGGVGITSTYWIPPRQWGRGGEAERRRRKMLGLKRLSVAQYERALVFRERSLERVLTQGVYWLWDPMKRLAVQTYDVAVPELSLPRADVLVAEARALLEPQVQIVELGDREVGLVYKNERLTGVLAPATRQLYWRGPVNVRVEVRDIANECALDANTARVLTRAKGVAGASDAVSTVEVPDTSVGLLVVDGELREVLKPGLSAYWKYQRVLRVELVDLRLQTMEVSGQEILTRDKVSLRVNLTALWQVTDAVKARATVSNFVDYVYKELQFALREAVGTRTLDELLGDKGALDREVSASAAKLEASGLAVRSVGVKDVILPGEMKTILNQVVEAEKVAQANLIRRREETAATRSLLNTARLMEENPTLLRLKELETLEKVTEKIGSLTVYDGLEGVLKNMVPRLS
jgi:regulator of protease activity HflC (stomatin/prohibitin superfamily)